MEKNIQMKKYSNKSMKIKKSTNTTEIQLIEVRQKQQEKFTEIKHPHLVSNPNKDLQKWSRNTTVMVGDSLVPGVGERGISKKDIKVKVKYFPGATVDDM